MIIADPPFLSEECLLKTVQSIKLLARKNAKVLLCTGAVMESLVSRKEEYGTLRLPSSHRKTRRKRVGIE